MRNLPVILFTLIVFAFYLTSGLTYASENKGEHENRNKDEAKLETRFETKINPSNNKGKNEDKSEVKIKIKIENEAQEDEEDEIEEKNNQKTFVEINKNRFEIRGEASNVTTDSFMINGQLIKIDLSVTGKIEIKGTLANGAFVQTEGMVVNNMLFAQEIKVKNNAGEALPTSTPQPSITPTTIPTATPSVTPSVTPTVTPEGKVFLDAKIKGVFTIDQLVAIFEKIINSLKSVLGASV